MPVRLLLFLVLLSSTLQAADDIKIAGVVLQPSASLESGTQLVLNGAGIRKKLFIKVYVGALYLEQKSASADAIINSSQPSRVLMHFIYDGVSRNKITDAWNTGFEKNHTTEELAILKTRIEKFNNMFTDTRAGDIILLDYLPGKGTFVSINNSQRGSIAGDDFNKALMKIWLGKHPVTRSLKAGLLGQ